MTSKIVVAALLAGSFAIAANAVAQPAGSAKSTCFYSNQFDSWKAASAKTIYIRVRPDRYFRLDMAAPCYAATRPGAFLITRLRGSSLICSALDWDLHVAQSWNGIPEACIVRKMTELSPAEVAKIPANAKP